MATILNKYAEIGEERRQKTAILEIISYG